MRLLTTNRKSPRLAATLLGASLLFAVGCHSGGRLPEKSSKGYGDFVSAFYVGLAALQVGDDVRAESYLSQATQLASGEPAGWANWGVLALRQRNFDASQQRLDRARELAPGNDQIEYLLGILESNRGNSQEAVAHLRKAVSLNPKNLRAGYQLALEVERQGDANSEAEFQQLMQQILAAKPDNLAALLELGRISAKRGDTATLRSTVARIAAESSQFPPEIKQQLTALETVAAGPDPRAAATRTIFLRNVLMRLPEFRQSLSVIKPQAGEEAQPFTHFLRMESPSSTPAPADRAMTFSMESLANAEKTHWDWIGAVSLTGEGSPVIAEADAREVKLSSGAKFPFPGGGVAPSPEGVLPIDLNYDFKTDLVLAGAGGLRFMRQDSPASFTDVTGQTKLPKAVLEASYTGAWAVDIEADGDLDIVLGITNGLPTVLRNNGDNSFSPMHPFAGISGIRQFAWADFNGDGNPDAAMIDGDGRLHVFINQRSGNFIERAVPANLTSAKAITVADVNSDGLLDLVIVQSTGAIARLSDKNEGQSWETAEIGEVPNPAVNLAGDVRLRAADLDNNGAIDLFLAAVSTAVNRSTPGALIWLANESGGFTLMDRPAGPPQVFDAADVKTDGRLALLGLTSDGQPQVSVNRGSKNYHWQIIRPRARVATGDQRINSFGVGGEIEIRAALLTQKLPITGPQLHFGLGEHTSADVARIVWPNGSVRAEFALKADQEIVTEQRLKGSCPFLFAFNGKQMEFVKDAVPWSSAIGLRINALGTARIAATEEWYKIGRDQLVPHDGFYDLRITGELWETYYYDYLSLMAVDHPAGTEIFTDERFVVPPAKLAVTPVATPHPILRATDDNGNDVTDTLRAVDGKYLDNFGRGQYQGVTRDHFVEIDLGDNVPTGGPLWLIAKGWLHPSDSSINVAISQGSHEQPRPLSLEIPDGHGGWVVARPNLGFPAGRKKICLIDLTNVFRPGMPHRLRLRTNLEIYWDSMEWAEGLPDAKIHITRLAPSTADLHYRGYSVIHQPNMSSPEVPDYNRLMATTQIWRDLPGYYTRYGDVRELLRGIDDRYVIMNAGDEMSLRFPAAAAPPPAGWVRDYVIAGDGWIKDGDYNSTYSQTILPLPYHARKEYDTAPGRLEDEWVYRHHPEDWQTYQTRYVTSDAFQGALRNQAGK